MPIIISKKIYEDQTKIKTISFLFSLLLHGSVLFFIFYKSVSKPVFDEMNEKRVSISLADFSVAHTESKKVITQKKLQEPVKKIQPIKQVKKEITQKSVQTTGKILPIKKNEKVEPSEAFTPQKFRAEQVTKEKSVKEIDSSKFISPSKQNNLPNNNAQPQDIGMKKLAQIRQMIQASLRYPTIAKKLGLEGVVTISFSLKQDGYIENLRLVLSSGSSALDRRALQTVQSLNGEYPSLSKKVDLKIPISFSLTKS